MIGPATPDDVPALVRLEEACLGDDAWSAELVTDGVSGSVPTVSWLVARADGALVGYAVVSCVPNDLAELQRIGVELHHRRRGVASALLGAAIDMASRSACDRLLLEVREDNAAALALYAARGFLEVDRRPGYYRDDAAAVVMGLRVDGS